MPLLPNARGMSGPQGGLLSLVHRVRGWIGAGVLLRERAALGRQLAVGSGASGTRRIQTDPLPPGQCAFSAFEVRNQESVTEGPRGERQRCFPPRRRAQKSANGGCSP